MKILLVINDISIGGGIERVVVNLANAFVEIGYEVDILSIYCKNQTLPYEIYPKVGLKYIYRFGEEVLKQKAKNSKFYKVYFKNFHKTYLSLVVGFKFRDYQVLIDNNWLSKPLFCSVPRYIKIIHYITPKFHTRNRSFDTLVLLTHSEAKRYLAYHKDVRIIPNFFPFIPHTCADLSQHRILSVGRLIEGKGFLRLIEIWALVQDSIKSTHKDLSNWQLIIVGSGELQEVIESKIKALNLQDSVILKPFTKNIEAEYLNASIYVMGSFSEGFGMVLLEAMFYGLPCVAFDIKTGPSDIIEDNKSGYLIEDNHLGDFAQKLKNLMFNESLREVMGKEAKKIANEKFSKEKIMQQWVELLNP